MSEKQARSNDVAVVTNFCYLKLFMTCLVPWWVEYNETFFFELSNYIFGNMKAKIFILSL